MMLNSQVRQNSEKIQASLPMWFQIHVLLHSLRFTLNPGHALPIPGQNEPLDSKELSL